MPLITIIVLPTSLIGQVILRDVIHSVNTWKKVNGESGSHTGACSEWNLTASHKSKQFPFGPHHAVRTTTDVEKHV